MQISKISSDNIFIHFVEYKMYAYKWIRVVLVLQSLHKTFQGYVTHLSYNQPVRYVLAQKANTPHNYLHT